MYSKDKLIVPLYLTKNTDVEKQIIKYLFIKLTTFTRQSNKYGNNNNKEKRGKEKEDRSKKKKTYY